jgi:adenylate kinase family enzyme
MPKPQIHARRIWILGSSCAGKSTLGGRLGQELELPHFALDELFWQPGWQQIPRQELRRQLSAKMDQAEAEHGGWVVDGNYTDTREALADRVELFVWLDLPLRTLVRRLISRTALRIVTRRPICNGNRETLRGALHPRDSLLLYLVRHYRRHRREAAAFVATRPHLHVRTANEATQLSC